jgi:hypothetical protein
MTLDQILMYAGAVAVCVGPLGSFLELVGETFGWARLVAFGQRLEALGADLPKLIRGSRATKLKAELELLKGDGPKTPRTGSVPPSGPAAAALLLLAGSLAISGALPACSSAATPEAQGAQAANLTRAAYNAATTSVKLLAVAKTTWTDALVASGDQAAMQTALPATQKVGAAIEAAATALAEARPYLADDGEARKRIADALGYADVALSLLDMAGRPVPVEARDALAFLRGFVGQAVSP